MNVALVYNVKQNPSDLPSLSEEGDEPPRRLSSDGRGAVHSIAAPSIAALDAEAEWDTMDTILAVKRALAERHDVALIEANEDAYDCLRALQPEIVFNMSEGMNGVSRESQIPAMLDFLRIPYTGSDPVTLGICLDKGLAKEVLAYHGIPTPRFSLVRSEAGLDHSAVPLPAIVKPVHEGSSKGIANSSVVRAAVELRSKVVQLLEEYHEPALVEEFLPGREFTVALLGNEADVRVLPIVEINFSSLPEGVEPIYSFEAKWVWDHADSPIDIFICPARIPEALKESIERICLRAYHALRCRDWCRIDVRLDDRGEPNIMELNPLPGVLPNPEEHSCFPMAAFAAGMTYNEMINSVLDTASRRCGLTAGRA